MSSTQDLPPFVPTDEFKYTTSPNPTWTYGQGIKTTPEGRVWAEGEKAGWTVLNGSTEDPRKLAQFMMSGIVPRPIAFVSSISADGIENLAPFSWFNQVMHTPPVVSFSCANSSGAVKDTLRNVRAGTGFTINIISEPWVEQADCALIDAPFEVDEWPITGLTKAPSIHVKAARVKESAFSMECELYQTVEITDPKTSITTATLVLALVKYIHIRNDVIDVSHRIVDPGKLKPIAAGAGILGAGLTYAKMSEGFVMPRRLWKDVREDITERLAWGAKKPRALAIRDGLDVSLKTARGPAEM